MGPSEVNNSLFYFIDITISSTTTVETLSGYTTAAHLLIHDCAPKHSLNHIIKFPDDTTVLGLISTNKKPECREVLEWFAVVCLHYTAIYTFSIDPDRQLC